MTGSSAFRSYAGIVEVAKGGGAALLTLNCPHTRNALTAELVAAIGQALDDLETDGVTRCVCITGAGAAFCAGAELRLLDEAAKGNFQSLEAVYNGFLRVLRSPLVTLAAINGPAVGAGFNLALACDIRVASEAARLDTRFAKLDIHPGGGHAWLLVRAVGQQQAMLATLFGRVWSGAEARDIGLVSAVHPPADLLDAALGLARSLERHDLAFVRRLTSTVRAAVTTLDHEEALAEETVAQHWSTAQEAFRARVVAATGGS